MKDYAYQNLVERFCILKFGGGLCISLYFSVFFHNLVLYFTCFFYICIMKLFSFILSKLIHNFRTFEGLLDDDLRESAYELLVASMLFSW